MLCTIENELLVAQVETKGAELQSVRSKMTGTEFIWQADPKIWGRHAPILFPVIGRLKGQKYTLGTKEYSISQHGFGRDLEFDCISHGINALSFLLRPSDFTHDMYPFEFALTVRYTLSGNQLKKEHIVTNRDSETMFFELGGHDGYRLALAEGETMGDYAIDFGDAKALHPILWEDVDGTLLMSDKRGEIPLTDGKLPISMDLFDPDAIVLDDIQPRRVEVRSTKSGYGFAVEYEDFPYLGIWTKPIDHDTNYICIEPWSTMPDAVYQGQELELKEDICILEPDEQQVLTYTTTFFDD